MNNHKQCFNKKLVYLLVSKPYREETRRLTSASFSPHPRASGNTDWF